MGIVIYSINNYANQETIKCYHEAELMKRFVRLSDNFFAADESHKLILMPNAVKEIFQYIEWDIGPRTDVRVEQGGILLGNRYYDEEKKLHFVIVEKALMARSAEGTSGYLEISHECWADMHKQKDAYNVEHQKNTVIVGWFHTHPNMLSCFMSGTDRKTQSLFFDGENTFSVVINPQRHLFKAFRGKECYPTQAFLMEAGKDR